MFIREMSLAEFKEFANTHFIGNFHESINYALIKAEEGFEYEFIAYGADDIVGAALILYKKIGNVYFGYSPRGFLIDYSNDYLLEDFTNKIKEYYKNRNFILKKPTLNSFEIKNLMEFVDESLKDDVENFVKVFIRDLYLNKNTFSRPVFEFKVFEYLQKLGNSKIFSKDNLEIIYSVFDSCDFNYELYNGKIYNEEERVFSDGLFLCKKVG